jgi:hypothetical protein
MRWARVAKPDAKPDAKQAGEPVSQKAEPFLSEDWARFGASWQDYERAMAARWAGLAVLAIPGKAEPGSLPGDAAAVEAGERE